jgi:hypothetical protein
LAINRIPWAQLAATNGVTRDASRGRSVPGAESIFAYLVRLYPGLLSTGELGRPMEAKRSTAEPPPQLFLVRFGPTFIVASYVNDRRKSSGLTV